MLCLNSPSQATVAGKQNKKCVAKFNFLILQASSSNYYPVIFELRLHGFVDGVNQQLQHNYKDEWAWSVTLID